MNKGNWFLTWRGPSKVNAVDEGNKIMRKSIVKRNFIFIMNNKLAEEGYYVKLHNQSAVWIIQIKKAESTVIPFWISA